MVTVVSMDNGMNTWLQAIWIRQSGDVPGSRSRENVMGMGQDGLGQDRMGQDGDDKSGWDDDKRLEKNDLVQEISGQQCCDGCLLWKYQIH